MNVILPNLEKDGLRLLVEKTCIWLNPKRGKTINLIQKLIVSFNVVCLFGHFVSMYYAGVEKSLKNSAFMAMILTVRTSQQVVFLLNQESLGKLLDSLDGFESRRSQEEKELFVKKWKPIWKVTDVYWKFYLIYWIIVFPLPVVLDLTAGWINPDMPSLRVPMPMEGFIDLVGPRTIYDLLISAFSNCWILVILPSVVAMDMSEILITVAVRSEMEIVCIKLERLKRLMDSKMYDSRTILNDVAVHHQHIVKVMKQINNVYGIHIAIQGTIYAGCFCFALYAATTVDDEEYMISTMQGLVGFSLLFFLLFYTCLEGESLETQNNEVQRCLYDLPWYEETPRFRKDLSFMIRQAQKPCVISYHGMFNLKLDTVMQIANTSYSYLMMLKSTGQ